MIQQQQGVANFSVFQKHATWVALRLVGGRADDMVLGKFLAWQSKKRLERCYGEASDGIGHGVFLWLVLVLELEYILRHMRTPFLAAEFGGSPRPFLLYKASTLIQSNGAIAPDRAQREPARPGPAGGGQKQRMMVSKLRGGAPHPAAPADGGHALSAPARRRI
jgi:hypothetical protein